ncbi:MAG TPA: ABC transporter ATP-binding protein [Thermodesulfovibrionales bacterium]|nr:ABC transporter ATP-binding protein [Thermodesulfovibrionales bacterium]
MSLVSNNTILDLQEVSFSYGEPAPFIRNISFSVREGEFIGLLGANGSGKSTILKLGSGILKPALGELTLWGKPIRTYKNKDRAKLICYLPQTLDITVPFTVRELVSMGLYPYDVPPSMTAEEALEMVGLGDRADAHLSDLSGGERRRTFIAMTLVQGAGLLLLDEPLANLDIRYQIELIRLLRRLREERNISILMALHDINIALQFEKVMLIKNGEILGLGDSETVLTDAMLKESFDVNIEVRRSVDGRAHIAYENNF